ncbi:MAG: hypothetical protein IT372_42500 [Polyangiaceae bacterium]|nr:hypothetical protein [Polyangiaceae bacterium]
MPNPKPKAVRTKALDLHRKGFGLDAILERLERDGHKVGRSTVGGWLSAARGRAQDAPGASAGQSPPPAPQASGAPPPAAQGAAPAPGPDVSPDLPGEARLAELAELDPRALDVQELEAIERDVRTYRERALLDDNPRVFALMVRLQIEVRGELARRRPEPEVDPEQDPANVAAREEVRARIAQLVAQAEGSPELRARMAARLQALGGT